MGKNHSFVVTAVRTLIVLILALCTGACGEKSFPPLASVPFDASKAGNSITIPVTVTSTNANLDHVYMVGFYMRDETEDGPAEQMSGYPPELRLYLRVRIFQSIDGRDRPVVIDDHDSSYDIKTGTFTYPPSMRDRATDIAYVSTSSYLNGVAHREVVRFKFPANGQYRVEISTISDVPALTAVPTWLTVEREFPHGK